MFVRALLLMASFFVSAPIAAAKPPVFMDNDLGVAIEAATEQSKIVVVDFTAVWCGPCQMMDRDTWTDPQTVAWLNEHAICVQVDVDEDQATSRAYKVRAMPTVVAIVGGKEFERNVGYMDGEKLVSWLEGVRRGESKVQRLIAQHGERVDENGHVDTRARYQLAKELADNGEHERALEEYLWLWQHMVEFEPSMVGVRSSFMASSMGELVATYEPARAAFADLRDQAEIRLKDKPMWDDLGDWITLNEVVGDQDKTLEWFDRVKQDPDKLHAAGRFAYKLDDLLRERGRWADLGRIIDDPMGDVRQDVYWLRDTLKRSGQTYPQHAASQTEYWLESIAQTYVALLAADRMEEARQVATFVFSLDDFEGARVVMIRTALEAGVAQAEHLDWMDEAESPPPGLREEVESALGAGISP